MNDSAAGESGLPAGLSRRRLIAILAMVSGLGPVSIDMYLPSLLALQQHSHPIPRRRS